MGVHEEKRRVFEGLFGVFNDSLPDGWGRLLLDREMDRSGIGRERLTPLDRLAFIGGSGMGALVYQPEYAMGPPPSVIDLQALASEALLKATRWLTRDQRAVEQVYRQMVFNVVANNRDDHSKNFAYLMDSEGRWGLAPAYDLTFSAGPVGEHWMTVAGEGRAPGRAHILALTRGAGVSEKSALAILAEVCDAVARWEEIAASAGVGRASRARIATTLERRLRDTR